MEAKDLIMNLLEHGADRELEVVVKGENVERHYDDLEVMYTYDGTSNSSVTLQINLGYVEIIDVSDYEKLEDERDAAVDRVEELESELASVRDELEVYHNL